MTGCLGFVEIDAELGVRLQDQQRQAFTKPLSTPWGTKRI